MLSAPAQRARQTAEALGLGHARIEPALADLDTGTWRGQRIVAIAHAAPDALEAWIADAGAAPHGGESFVDVARRTGA
ncbi:MAG: Glucosyl-3-phosphoglycerate phosphatase [Burkholderia plantarii]|nr:MAG: Glucosyl-3-phosphoglycerate phosphatase [Burkholderia plantarii]